MALAFKAALHLPSVLGIGHGKAIISDSVSPLDNFFNFPESTESLLLLIAYQRPTYEDDDFMV